MSHYESIVISGGGVRGFSILGALGFISQFIDLSEIDTLVGTSVGSMICYFLAIGYTPQEILTEILSSRVLDKLKNYNIMACVQGDGACSFLIIHEFLEKKTIAKIGQLATLKKLKELTGKTLRLVTYNMTTRSTEILDHETNPDLPCLTAIRMSSNLPYLFAPFKYKDSIYLDGGLVNNFPIDLADGKAIGFVLGQDGPGDETAREFNLLKFSMKLLSISINSNTRERLEKHRENHEIIEIVSSRSGVDFGIDHSQQLDMYSDGYTAAKECYMK
jgi:predicted acylesterase/phospholipase RssA